MLDGMLWISACTLLLAKTVLALILASRVKALDIPPASIVQDTVTDTGLPTLVPEAEQMFDWIRQHGGQVHVVMGTLPGTGRKLFATKAFNKGDTLFEVPLELTYRFLLSKDEKDCDLTLLDAGYDFYGSAAAKLCADMNDPASPYQPYFQLLPKGSGVWSVNDIPDTYLPLIQNKALEAEIATLHRETMGNACCTSSSKAEGHPAHAGCCPSEEEARYILSLLETRVYGLDPGDSMQFVPLMDFADHSNDSPNYYDDGPCSNSSGGSLAADLDSPKQCFVAYAGAPIQAWEEVTMQYRYLLQDVSLIQYGFLQEGPVSKKLSRIDRHDFDPTDPWLEHPPHGDQDGPWNDFEVTDNAEATMVEISRLEQLLSNMTAADGVLSSNVMPHPRDTDGWFLQQLWVWRGQRQDAIRLELDRIKQAAKETTKDEL